MTTSPYIGRFAPTPTGPLHFGSLVAALASYLDAKSNHGQWLLRIEDLDPPRESDDAKQLIPQQLLDHGLQWDGPISLQSQHSSYYEKALSHLRQQGLIFPCACSRKQLAPHLGLHQGKCAPAPNSSAVAWRLALPNFELSFHDAIFASQPQNLAQAVGDFVLKRKDGLYAYQLAVVVDDFHQGVTHVVRGADLLDNTQRQLYLQSCLGYPQPNHMHLPLALNSQGQKLSKQNQATSIDAQPASLNLYQALVFLNQNPPAHLRHISCQEQLVWGIDHWNKNQIRASWAGI